MKPMSHGLYYILELTILLAGFYLVYLLSYDFRLQIINLAFVLLIYSLIGMWHHKSHHSLKSKIVVEYLLVSILIFACFLFLNAGKI